MIPSTLTSIPVVPPNPAEPGSWLAEWHRRDFLELDAVDTAPGEVRKMIRARLPLWGLDHLQDSTVLVATELTTNSIAATRLHVAGLRLPSVRVWLLGSDAKVAVAVGDDVPMEPVPRAADLWDETGRGLAFVESLSSEWKFWFPAPPFTGKVTMAVISQA